MTDDTGDDRSLTVRRLIAAPRPLVWRAWTDPVHLPQWWGPEGFTCRTREIDLRPGGIWRFDMIGPDGTVYRNRQRFREMTEPERISYVLDDDGIGEKGPFNATATFDTQGDKTLLTLRMVFDSPETREAMIRFGAVEGGQSTLNCLEAYLARNRAALSGAV